MKAGQNCGSRRGIVPVEITLVLAALAGLGSVVALGVITYRDGAHRAHCQHNLAVIQNAVRSYQHLHGKEAGEKITVEELVASGCLSDSEFRCLEAESDYVFSDVIPKEGVPFVRCGLGAAEGRNHRMPRTKGW
jgi:hypothetical protein